MRNLIALTFLLGGLPLAYAEDANIQLLRAKVQEHLQKKVEDLDSNGDGYISKKEYLSNAEKQFDRLDKDDDGKLSASERERWLTAQNRPAKRRRQVEIQGKKMQDAPHNQLKMLEPCMKSLMNVSLLSRYAFFALCLLFTLFSLPFWAHEWLRPFTLTCGVLSLIGVIDVIQKRYSVRRNYPILGNLRYLIEAIRPEIRQYLIEGDNDRLPFSRSQRLLVYARAHNRGAEKPFGTLIDVYENGFEFIGHSMRPAPLTSPDSFRVEIGGPQCTQPYSASLFNISAMSFGALSGNAICSLNKGAKLGNFFHDTGEGAISPYHLKHGGDLVWEIGSGYFGCRTLDGRFDPQRFAEQAKYPHVKMIEIKLSQGAKPGHGGILPKDKITEEISKTRGVSMTEDCVSPARHSAFSTPLEFIQFIGQLRALSGGKPVGFKLASTPTLLW